jgi:hypothetical protein
MSISEYVATVLATTHGLPELAPTAIHTSGQTELPLTRSA